VSALPRYTFDGYTLRPAGEEDRELAQKWNAADADHAWEMTQPDYWVEQRLGINSYVLEDGTGTIFFFKMIQPRGDKFIEVSMQFNRADDAEPTTRTLRGMIVGFMWLLKILPVNGVEAVYFSSRNVALIDFFEKRFGFVEVKNDRVSQAAGFRRFMRKVTG
jgi:hypothetical protein